MGDGQFAKRKLGSKGRIGRLIGFTDVYLFYVFERSTTRFLATQPADKQGNYAWAFKKVRQRTGRNC